MSTTANYNVFTELQLYPVNQVKKGYQYYLNLLTEKCLGMYLYNGLPASLPADQVELKLILQGYCVIFKTKDTLVTSNGGLSGIDKYYLPTDFVWAQPALGSGHQKLWKDAVIIYNNTIDKYARVGLSEIIMRTARMLADIDSSIEIITVNQRATKLNVAANKAIATTVDAAMKKLADGELYTINTQSLLDLYKTTDWNSNTRQQAITELLNAKQQIMGGFLSEIGVKNFTEKKERLITDEVTADDQLLTINVDDMEGCRALGIDQVNNMFGTDVTVVRNPSYNVDTFKGGSENDA